MSQDNTHILFNTLLITISEQMPFAGRLKTLEFQVHCSVLEREPMLGEMVTLVPWAAPDTGASLQLVSQQRTCWIISVQDRVLFDIIYLGSCSCGYLLTPQAFKEKKPAQASNSATP